jgi:Tol biopolymer transport system component
VLFVALVAGCNADSSTGTASPSTSAPTPSPSAARTPAPTRGATPAPTPWIESGQLVFEDNRLSLERHQLWITDATGVHQLLQSTFDDQRPSLSPDGRTVLFMRGGDGLDQAYFIDIDGSNLRKALVCDDLCDPEGDAWSPDGRSVVINRAFGFTNASGEFEIGDVSIWTIYADGTGLVALTSNPLGSRWEDHRPVWSPDGHRVAFARTDNGVRPLRTAIFTLAVDGTDLVQVTSWELDANEPDWSPDGEWIAFSSPAAALQPAREQNIFKIHPDGTQLVQLTEHLEANPDGSQGTFDPSWSPDGSMLVFTHIPSTGGLADLYVMDADGTGMHVLAKTGSLNESHAVWGVRPAT